MPLQSIAALWVYNCGFEKCFRGFWLRRLEGWGLFCFFWPGNQGQATVLDISVNFNWLWKYTSLTYVHATLTVVLGVWLTDKNGFLDTQSHCVHCIPGKGGRRFAYINSAHVCTLVMTGVNALFKIFRSKCLYRPSVLKAFIGRQQPSSKLFRKSRAGVSKGHLHISIRKSEIAWFQNISKQPQTNERSRDNGPILWATAAVFVLQNHHRCYKNQATVLPIIGSTINHAALWDEFDLWGKVKYNVLIIWHQRC